MRNAQLMMFYFNRLSCLQRYPPVSEIIDKVGRGLAPAVRIASAELKNPHNYNAPCQIFSRFKL